MEPLHPTTFPESLKATLNCYQLTSVDSLSGPSGYPALAAQMWFKENKQLPPIPRQPMVQIPFFIPNDKSAKRSETSLAGEKIACFIVGGEKRLCLPQILTSVLREYSIAEINQACADLHIYCSRCLPEQLEVLKALGILPINTAQCGLITKTDAERLAALLMDQHESVKSLRDRLPKDIEPESGFQVYHECFGRGYGKFYPKVYDSPTAPCILCEDCRCLYTPQRFIAHSHRSFEKRTCHWGFDPEHWRSYLLLPKNLEGPKREEHQKILDQMKARFDQQHRFDLTGPPPLRYTGSPPTPSKRRYDSEQESPSRKKMKEDDVKIFEPGLIPNPYASLQYGVPSAMRHSAFRPWSPGLSSMVGPNPDVPGIQDLTHLKNMMSLGFDRRGFPHYLNNGRPVVLGTRASEFPAPMPPDARPIPTVRVVSSDERRKSLDNIKVGLRSPPHDAVGEKEKDKNNNHPDHVTVQQNCRALPKIDLTGKHSSERSLQDRPRKPSMSPARHPPNVAEVSPRSRHRNSPIIHSEHIPPTSTSQTIPKSTSSLQSSNNNNTLKEPNEANEIKRPVSRSREAAATAMLELKSSGLYRSNQPPTTPLSPPISSSSSKEPSLIPATLKSSPCILPLDYSRQHYKWSIGSNTYIVSAAGVQSLEMLRSLIETECGSESSSGRLMHELVKMRVLFEEKLDIEKRVRRDLEISVDQMKSNKREKLQAKSETRKLIRQDMENMRQEHTSRMENLAKLEEALHRKLEDKKHGGANSDSLSIERKDYNDLRSRIQELELRNDKLRMDLIEEREKREDAELKLEESNQNSRGRIPFLTESPLARMVRGVGRRILDEENGLSPPSAATMPPPHGRRKSSTQIPMFSTGASTSHCQPDGDFSTATAQHLNSLDCDAEEIVVVS